MRASRKHTIPDWQAFPRGFKDAMDGKPNLAHLCPPEAREEYNRGYADGQERAKTHPRKRKGRPPMKPAASAPKGIELRVEVTAEIIQHSIVRNSSHCMTALAIRDTRPDLTSIHVDLQTIRFTDREKGFRYTYLTPRVVQEAIIKFDQGEIPEPFAFVLRGAHVTKMTRHKASLTPRLREPVDKPRLVDGSIRVGGKPPPVSNLAKRREFGLKALRI